jgi:hypothetical protein
MWQGRERQAGSGSGQAERSKPGKTKTETRTDRSKGTNAGRLHKTKRTGNRQTENTGINTLGIIGKMGNN